MEKEPLITVSVRLPKSLHAQLSSDAESNRRSLAAEMVYRLEHLYNPVSTAPPAKKKPAAKAKVG